ncbi:MAG: glycogen/starch synthase, partial [Algicola sp.]|nr:glycogen/starch synthase [Algicola sp.]
LPGAKVGGIGDVVRDIPTALAQAGQQVDVVIPAYGALHQLPGAQFIGKLQVPYCSELETVAVYKVALKNSHKNVTQWVLEHPLFSAGGVGKVYCDDPSHSPFATDARKFALFSAAVAKAVVSNIFGQLDVLHLHDWHTAMLAVLRAYDPHYQALKSIHTVYTVHNLALQGIRPLEGDKSSLSHWFPELVYDGQAIGDPKYHNCFNPMRAGINLSDKVHVVSQNYAREILLPSIPEQGYCGGEGLEQDLCRAHDEGRLQGILNGCEYPEQKTAALPNNALLKLCEDELLKWIAAEPTVASAHMIALTRLSRLVALKVLAEQSVLVTSVGRITDQKVSLLLLKNADGKTALEQLLEDMGSKGLFILLGSGDAQMELQLTKIAAVKDNLLFLKGYSETLSKNLYASGDLFVMPSSFEPCGISQMLAMRAGQPCLAHGVGGLSDTIEHHKNGFIFTGDNQPNQVANMLSAFDECLRIRLEDKKRWQQIVDNAEQSRFLWADAATGYVDRLYT